MSDSHSGTGAQLGLTSQPLNVASGSVVRFQHVMATGAQNLNVQSAGGQQFVISQVSVSGLSQVIPTISTSNTQQTGVTRILNITQPQRVVIRGALQLSSPGADGRVSFVAISPSPGQFRAATHPILVTYLASPVRPLKRPASASVSSPNVIASSSNTHVVSRTAIQSYVLPQTSSNTTRKRPKSNTRSLLIMLA